MHINFGLPYGKVFQLTPYGVYISSSSCNFDTRIKLVCGKREIRSIPCLRNLPMCKAPKLNSIKVSELHEPQYWENIWTWQRISLEGSAMHFYSWNETGLIFSDRHVEITVKRRMPSSGMLRRIALVWTDVSEERSASIIRVARIGELRTALACFGCYLLLKFLDCRLF
jgi:hypothetical protein